jgi:hypothetical protein
MATQADVRRIARSLPEVVEEQDRFAFSVVDRGKPKGICWVWLERVDPKKARVPNPAVLGVRVASLADKDLLLASDDRKFFTEPHYNGYPAVLVRLAEVTAKELRALLTAAWQCQVSRAVARGGARSASRPSPSPAPRRAARARTRRTGGRASSR